MSVDLFDRVADLLEGQGQADVMPIFPQPGDLARYIDPRTVQTPALDILDAALIDAANGTSSRLIFSMPPQEGKTQRVARTMPLWLLHRNPQLRIGVVSYAEDLAVQAAGQVKNDIISHPALGLTLRKDARAKGEWKLDGYDGGVIARGIGGGLAGRPLDVLIIDDPLKDRTEADSPVFRERAWRWWTEVGSARLGAASVVIVISTRWHEDDLIGRLLAQDEADGTKEWRYINLPAQADHTPGAGDDCRCGGQTCLGSDVLGRPPGEFMISARGRTVQQWEQRKRAAGARSWAALYQGHPSPGDGLVFKRSWWRFFSSPRWVERSDGTMHVPGQGIDFQLHVDCAFKDAESSDYVAMILWVRNGPRIWLADLINEHMDVVETADAILALRARWPQLHTVVIEDKANGPAVIQILRRKISGVVEYTPTDSKLGRAYAAAPFVEAGDIELPSPQIFPKIGAYLEQVASFPVGTHDDMVDATTQAADRMLLRPGNDQFMRQLLAEQGALNDRGDTGQLGHSPWNPQTPTGSAPELASLASLPVPW